MLNWTCHPNMSRVVIFPGLILAVIFRSLSFSHSPCLFCQNQPHWSSLQIYPDWGHFLPPSLVHPGPAILIFLSDCLKSLLHFLFLLLILFQSLLNIPPRCYCSNLRQMLSLHPSLGSHPRVRNSWWALTPHMVRSVLHLSDLISTSLQVLVPLPPTSRICPCRCPELCAGHTAYTCTVGPPHRLRELGESLHLNTARGMLFLGKGHSKHPCNNICIGGLWCFILKGKEENHSLRTYCIFFWQNKTFRTHTCSIWKGPSGMCGPFVWFCFVLGPAFLWLQKLCWILFSSFIV